MEPRLPAVDQLIFVFRGQRVMLSNDLAKLYEVEARSLVQAVKRNRENFPQDFMFQLTPEETRNWRSQIVTSNSGYKMGLRYLPYAFTEQGVAMLSSVLKSRRARQMNVAIMRAFVKLRETLALHRQLALKLEALEGKVVGHDADIKKLFEAIKGLMEPEAKPERRVGFRPEIGDHKL